MLNDYFHAYVIIDFLTNLSVFLIRSHIRLGQFYFIFPIKVSLESGRLETISVLINIAIIISKIIKFRMWNFIILLCCVLLKMFFLQ